MKHQKEEIAKSSLFGEHSEEPITFDLPADSPHFKSVQKYISFIKENYNNWKSVLEKKLHEAYEKIDLHRLEYVDLKDLYMVLLSQKKKVESTLFDTKHELGMKKGEIEDLNMDLKFKDQKIEDLRAFIDICDDFIEDKNLTEEFDKYKEQLVQKED